MILDARTADWSVTTIEDSVALATIAKEWQGLAQQQDHDDFYSTPLWFRLVLTHTGDSFDRPLILAARHQGTLAGVFPLAITRLKRQGISVRVLHWLSNLYSPRGGAISAASLTKECGRIVATHCCRHLGELWDVCELRDVRSEDAATHSFLETLDSRYMTWSSMHRDSVVVSVPNDTAPTELFRSRGTNFRQNMRKSMNRLARQGGFAIRQIESDSDGLDEAIDQYYEVLRRSWKEAERYPSFHRSLIKEAAAGGQLRLFLLYSHPGSAATLAPAADLLNGGIPTPRGVLTGHSPCAVALFVVAGQTAHYLKTLYTEESADFSAGSLLTWAAFWQLFVREGVLRVDFQRGLEAYKFLWSDELQRHATYLVANPGMLRGRILVAAKRLRQRLKPPATSGKIRQAPDRG